jgi:hypothetical protein
MKRTLLISMMLAVIAAAAEAQQPQGTSGRRAVLWTDPGDMTARNLFWGPGSEDRAPRPPFTFVEEDTDGTQPKVIVRDAAGREWTAKFGTEVHSGIAASRLLWAFGYGADEMYFVEHGTIAGAKGLKRAAEHVGADGAFHKASFRLRDGAERAKERWLLTGNPFSGSKELSGLKILMTMICNWDIQGDRNNRIVSSGDVDRYIVTDLGASFGKMGTFLVPRSKWDLDDFQKEEFIEKVEDGMVDLDYEGYEGIDKVPVEHARWFAGLASRLTDKQIADAFRAAGATPEEVAGFTARIREKILELQKAVGGIILRP